MPVVRYIARRSLLGGVSVGQTVTYNIPTRYAAVQRDRQPIVSTRVSLNGRRESYYYRGDVKWTIGSLPLSETDAPAMRQFLDSVEDGQEFDFAPYDRTTTSPIDYRKVIRDSAGPEQPTAVKQDYIAFAFVLVEVTA